MRTTRFWQRLEHKLVDGKETVGHFDRLLLRDLFSVCLVVEATKFLETLR
jgi:hypothetical protein